MAAATEISKSCDEDASILAKVRAELAKSLQENARLQAELKETQATLGQFVVSSQRQGQSNPIPGPSRRPEPSLTRVNPYLSCGLSKAEIFSEARSSSPEIVEIPEPPRKKQKQTETYDTPPVTTKTRNLAFIDLLHKNSSGPSKAESSQLQTSPSISKPALKPVASASIASSTSPAAPRNAKQTEPQPPTPTPKVVKSSPSEMKHRIKPEKLTPRSKNAKAKVAREDEESASGTDSSTSSVATGNLSPTEDKPKSSIKIKTKDVFTLPDATVRQYLQSTSTIRITPPPLGLQVPRMFLRLAYGGSDQQFLSFIQKDKNPSGPVQRRIVFPMLGLNPAMPSRPGEPGLLFTSRNEILSNPPWTLFCKLSSAAPAVWLYLGEYESVLCGKMTAAQFKSQTLVVKKEWAKLILGSKKVEAYVSMRARIALRKAGIIPVDNKVIEYGLINAEMVASPGLPVIEEDIISAFSNGDEAIDIIRMTCIKYDHVFANDMKAKFANYDTLLAANKRKKDEAGPSTSVSTTPGSRPRRSSRRSVSRTAGRFGVTDDEDD